MGSYPCDLAHSSSATTTALPASHRAELVPAVTVPPSRKMAGSRPSFSMLVSALGISSVAKVMVSFFLFTVTGTVSSSKSPFSTAARAFLWLSKAKASCSSRLMSYSSTRISAVAPIIISARGHMNPSLCSTSIAVLSPILWPQRASGRI